VSDELSAKKEKRKKKAIYACSEETRQRKEKERKSIE